MPTTKVYAHSLAKAMRTLNKVSPLGMVMHAAIDADGLHLTVTNERVVARVDVPAHDWNGESGALVFHYGSLNHLLKHVTHGVVTVAIQQEGPHITIRQGDWLNFPINADPTHFTRAWAMDVEEHLKHMGVGALATGHRVALSADLLEMIRHNVLPAAANYEEEFCYHSKFHYVLFDYRGRTLKCTASNELHTAMYWPLFETWQPFRIMVPREALWIAEPNETAFLCVDMGVLYFDNVTIRIKPHQHEAPDYGNIVQKGKSLHRASVQTLDLARAMYIAEEMIGDGCVTFAIEGYTLKISVDYLQLEVTLDVDRPPDDLSPFSFNVIPRFVKDAAVGSTFTTIAWYGPDKPVLFAAEMRDVAHWIKPVTMGVINDG
jgi:hypothetical protein